MAQLDETITTGDLGHESDHETLARKANYVFDVKDFGAAGDGVTDDSAAFAACIQAAIAETYHSSILVPAGKFKIVSPNIFSDIDATGQVGLHVEGVGWKSSIILFEPTSTGWLYNNGGTSRLQFATFSNLGFEGDGATNGYANGFWITSSGHDQGFAFTNVFMENFQRGFLLDGSATADQMKFFNFRTSGIYGDFYTLSNPQSVGHYFYGCNFWGHLGDLFVVDGGGGGTVHVIGGDLVMADGTTDNYIINITGSANVGSTNGLFTFRDFRSELRFATNKIVNIAGVLGEMDIVFDGTRWSDTSATTRAVVQGVTLQRKVIFRDSKINELWEYEFERDSNGYADNTHCGVIGFEGCRLPADISDKFTFADSYGRAYARNCTTASDGAANYDRDAADFDLNWRNNARGDIAPVVKTAVIKAQGTAWPYNSLLEHSIVLPRDSLIRSIHIHKPALGASSSAYQLHVGTEDKGVTHGSSTSAQMKDAHTITLDDLNYDTSSAANERTVRLWATGGDGPQEDIGYAIVEYI